MQRRRHLRRGHPEAVEQPQRAVDLVEPVVRGRNPVRERGAAELLRHPRPQRHPGPLQGVPRGPRRLGERGQHHGGGVVAGRDPEDEIGVRRLGGDGDLLPRDLRDHRLVDLGEQLRRRRARRRRQEVQLGARCRAPQRREGGARQQHVTEVVGPHDEQAVDAAPVDRRPGQRGRMRESRHRRGVPRIRRTNRTPAVCSRAHRGTRLSCRSPCSPAAPPPGRTAWPTTPATSSTPCATRAPTSSRWRSTPGRSARAGRTPRARVAARAGAPPVRPVGLRLLAVDRAAARRRRRARRHHAARVRLVVGTRLGAVVGVDAARTAVAGRPRDLAARPGLRRRRHDERRARRGRRPAGRPADRHDPARPERARLRPRGCPRRPRAARDPGRRPGRRVLRLRPPGQGAALPDRGRRAAAERATRACTCSCSAASPRAPCPPARPTPSATSWSAGRSTAASPTS